MYALRQPSSLTGYCRASPTNQEGTWSQNKNCALNLSRDTLLIIKSAGLSFVFTELNPTWISPLLNLAISLWISWSKTKRLHLNFNKRSHISENKFTPRYNQPFRGGLCPVLKEQLNTSLILVVLTGSIEFTLLHFLNGSDTRKFEKIVYRFTCSRNKDGGRR